MKLTVPGLLLLLASAASASTERSVDAALAKGARALEAARDAKGSKLLKALEAAKPHFRRARALAMKASEGAAGAAMLERGHAATGRLVEILNAETAIHLDRGALPLAKKRNGEALALLPADARAKALATAIRNPTPYEFDVRVVDTLLGGSGRAGRPAGQDEADRRVSARR